MVFILQIRYILFTSLVAVYGVSFAIVGGTAGRALPVWYPLLLLTLTAPTILMNYFLTLHFHRIDTYLRALETFHPEAFHWQRAYSRFRLYQKMTRSAWVPKFWAQSAYTIPLLLAYSGLIVLGAVSSLVAVASAPL